MLFMLLMMLTAVTEENRTAGPYEEAPGTFNPCTLGACLNYNGQFEHGHELMGYGTQVSLGANHQLVVKEQATQRVLWTHTVDPAYGQLSIFPATEDNRLMVEERFPIPNSRDDIIVVWAGDDSGAGEFFKALDGTPVELRQRDLREVALPHGAPVLRGLEVPVVRSYKGQRPHGTEGVARAVCEDAWHQMWRDYGGEEAARPFVNFEHEMAVAVLSPPGKQPLLKWAVMCREALELFLEKPAGVASDAGAAVTATIYILPASWQPILFKYCAAGEGSASGPWHTEAELPVVEGRPPGWEPQPRSKLIYPGSCLAVSTKE